MTTRLMRFGGKVVGVEIDGSVYNVEHQKWQEFLDWNAKQPVPLDLSDKEPEPVVVDPDLLLAVNILKAIPASWKNGTQTQQITWALRRVLIELRQELKD